MTYWLFATDAEAEAAQDQCFDHVPDNTLSDGQVAPVQVNQRWADVVTTTDGRFGFIAYPKMSMPGNAVTMSDDDFAAIMPKPVDPIA